MSEHVDGTPSLFPYEIVARFPIGTFLENLAVRSNGTLLVSNMISGEIFYIDPNDQNSHSTVQKIHDFNDGLGPNSPDDKGEHGAYGSKHQAEAIVEDPEEADVFYTFSGLHGKAATWAIYRLDMRNFNPSSENKLTVGIEKVVDVPEAVWLNGATMIPQSSTLVIAESQQGKLIGYNVRTGDVSVWLQDIELGKATKRPSWPAINGVQYFRNNIYATVSDRGTLLRMGVDEKGDYKKGSLQVVSKNLAGDDLAFDIQGNAYVSTNVAHTVLKLNDIGLGGEESQQDGRFRILGALDQKETAGPTAVAFGRTESDAECIYVTTNGGLPQPVGDQGPGEAVVVKINVAVKGEK